LPLSGAHSHHASSLSPSAIGTLFDEARKRFDTILIDTGPVPGSLEASIAAAQADGVIAIISRGESRRVVERCLEHLRTVGASLMGIVFNRANEADMATRGTTKRISSTLRESRPRVNSSAPQEQQYRADFGPVARAVASAASSSNGSRRRSTNSETEKPQ
jgi:Mrp family chromosome partitioning ATPase